MLTVRGHAYAMSGAGHLGGEHFRAQLVGGHDQHAIREVFSSCLIGATLDEHRT